jgi:cation:H+ antiporter
MMSRAVAYTVMVIRTSQRERASVSADISAPGLDIRERRGGPYRDAAELVIGIGIIVVGGDLLVDGAVQLAKALGVTEALIGLTVIAIGTSAPELATVIVSTIRGDRSIAVGNLLGSSVYNIVFILGVTMVASPEPMEVPEPVRQVDLILMTAVALACIPIFRRGHRLSRPEGAAFVAAYLLYLGYLLVART